jgi:glycerol-3-phosphate dehydrogenase
VLVNAAGPWVNRVVDKISPAPPRRSIDLVRGTHIRVAGHLQAGNYYLEAPVDGRAVFAMPRDGSILVGTTERIDQSGDPAGVAPARDEHDYLLDLLAYYFPRYRDQANRVVISSYAGLRVLQKSAGRAFDRSRETGLVTDSDARPRLISIYGGKLTTWRATAAKVMARIAVSLPSRKRRARTDQLTLSPD